MKRSSWERVHQAVQAEAGFTLLEVVAVSSILALIIVSIMPLLLTLTRDQKGLQVATDRMESIRQTASMLTQDARFARSISCNWKDVSDPATGDWYSVQYIQMINGSTIIQYLFADRNDEVDYTNLHRLQGASVNNWEAGEVGDVVIARDLVFSEWPEGTELSCAGGSYRGVWANLAFWLDADHSSAPARFDIYAYPRAN